MEEVQMVYLPFSSWLWLTIIAAVISLVWYFVLKIRTAGGYWFQLIIAWIGAWLGTPVFGNWVFTANNVSIIPAVLASIAAVMFVAGASKIWTAGKQ